MKFRFLFCFALLPALLIPSTANADIGIPLIMVWYPPMIYALIPFIGIEAWVMFTSLNITIWEAIIIMGITNLLSTLIGIPIAWFLVHGLTPRRFNVFWFMEENPPWYEEGKFWWQVYAGHFLLLILFFLGSWSIEYYMISEWFLTDIDPMLINNIAFKANAITYFLLAIALVVFTFMGWKNFQKGSSEKNKGEPKDSKSE